MKLPQKHGGVVGVVMLLEWCCWGSVVVVGVLLLGCCHWGIVEVSLRCCCGELF